MLSSDIQRKTRMKDVATPVSRSYLLNRDNWNTAPNSGIFWKGRRLNFTTARTLWSGLLKVCSTRQKYPW